MVVNSAGYAVLLVIYPSVSFVSHYIVSAVCNHRLLFVVRTKSMAVVIPLDGYRITPGASHDELGRTLGAREPSGSREPLVDVAVWIRTDLPRFAEIVSGSLTRHGEHLAESSGFGLPARDLCPEISEGQ
jgi:hypothetical protein